MTNTKEEKKLQRVIVQAIIDGAIAHGNIDPKNKSESELKKEIRNYLHELGKDEREFRFVIDYREDLLLEARRYAELGRNEIACLFYAIWFEHWANSLIVALGSRKKMREEEIILMIRELSFHSKLALMPVLFGLPRLNKTYVDKILKTVEIRNSFVHYKWQGKTEQMDDRHQEEINKVIQNIGNVVKYLNSYGSRHLFHGQKHLVRKIV